MGGWCTSEVRRPHPMARNLRKAMPPAEQFLWIRIRRAQLGGFRFRRQHTIGPYIADFACIEARLVIELDGDQHGRDDAPRRDAARDAFLMNEGWRVRRFWNHEVFSQTDAVLQTIWADCMAGVAS